MDAKTHKYVTTGLDENKFGISLPKVEEVLKRFGEFENIELDGIHFHIGSQITDMNVFRELCERINNIQQWFDERGVVLKTINTGGGLGVDYKTPKDNQIPDFEYFFGIYNQYLKLKPHQTLHFELGRSLVAQCGYMISKVTFVKEGLKTKFAIVDAGMTDLIRPALYQAKHFIENITSDKPAEIYDVVGPICESSDVFDKGIELAETQRGDLLAFYTAGAYAEIMASQYNLRDMVHAVYSE